MTKRKGNDSYIGCIEVVSQQWNKIIFQTTSSYQYPININQSNKTTKIIHIHESNPILGCVKHHQ